MPTHDIDAAAQDLSAALTLAQEARNALAEAEVVAEEARMRLITLSRNGSVPTTKLTNTENLSSREHR